MKKRSYVVIAALSAQFFFSACNLPGGLESSLPGSSQTVRAVVLTTASGQSLRVVDLEQLPEAFRNAPQLQAILDNSNTTYTVVRNADGSLSIPLPAGRRPDSEGIIELVLTNGQTSQLLRFDTSPLVKLGSDAFKVEPAKQVILGTALQLTANLQENAEPQRYSFLWSAATSLQGQFQTLSGTGPTIEWKPEQPGNYFLRLELRDLQTGASSLVTSATPVVFVQAADSIVITTPADGRILTGDSIGLKANIPEQTTNNYLWGYAQSPVGPFQPIAAQGQSIEWEPPASGAYYLRLQLPGGSQDSYVSSRPLVQVAPPDEFMETQPQSGEITRGQSIQLAVDLPGTAPDSRYLWSFSNSPQGPFRSISSEGKQISWVPDETGEFYLRVRLIEADGSEKTYTTTKVKVSVRDSDDNFQLSPQPASLVKGQSVFLALKQNVASNRVINWSYSAQPQGPFQPISGQGQNTRWTPPAAGSYYLRAEITGGSTPKSTLTSATALVSVTESPNILSAQPSSINLGQALTLRANLPESQGNERYTWSVGPSAAGPWEPAQSLSTDTQGSTLQWYPPREGSYFIKTDVLKASGEVISFVSPQAQVFVNNTPAFFATSPNPALIGTQGAVELSALFQPPAGERLFYAWSAGFSPTGPFNAIGGSLQLRFNWVRPGVAGSYYIKLDVISETSGKSLSFFSSNPLVFAGESQSTVPRF